MHGLTKLLFLDGLGLLNLMVGNSFIDKQSIYFSRPNGRAGPNSNYFVSLNAFYSDFSGHYFTFYFKSVSIFANCIETIQKYFHM